MSGQYDNTNSGALHRNDKRQNDKQPEYRGQCLVQCPKCHDRFNLWLSAWVRTAKASGRKFFSLAFEPKEDPGAYRGGTTTLPRHEPPAAPPTDDEVPF